MRDVDKPVACVIARRMRAAGYEIVASAGTAAALQRARIRCTAINKVLEGSPHVVDAIRGGTVAMVVNMTVGAREVKDSYSIRRQTLLMKIPYFTTIAAAHASYDALDSARGDGGVRVRAGVGRRRGSLTPSRSSRQAGGVWRGLRQDEAQRLAHRRLLFPEVPAYAIASAITPLLSACP